MSESDSEYEETEYLVVGEFGNLLTTQELQDPNAAMKIIGFDTKRPLMEINGKIFQGTHDLAEGTNLIFVEDTEAKTNPPFEECPSTMYKLSGSTKRILKFERIFVESKTSENKNDKEENAEDTSLKLDITYNEAIKLFSQDENA